MMEGLNRQYNAIQNPTGKPIDRWLLFSVWNVIHSNKVMRRCPRATPSFICLMSHMGMLFLRNTFHSGKHVESMSRVAITGRLTIRVLHQGCRLQAKCPVHALRAHAYKHFDPPRTRSMSVTTGTGVHNEGVFTFSYILSQPGLKRLLRLMPSHAACHSSDLGCLNQPEQRRIKNQYIGNPTFFCSGELAHPRRLFLNTQSKAKQRKGARCHGPNHCPVTSLALDMPTRGMQNLINQKLFLVHSKKEKRFKIYLPGHFKLIKHCWPYYYFCKERMLDMDILMYQKTTPTNIMHRAFSLVCHMIAFTYDAGLNSGRQPEQTYLVND